MTKEAVLQILQAAEGPVSGQQISSRLGVSRMAVCKAVSALRQDGFAIESAPRRGYRLRDVPQALSRPGVLSALGEHPWADRVTVLETVDSTNNYLKALAPAAPNGTVVIADQQTGGRGRMGRSFSSPKGRGVYLSVLLRLRQPPAQLLHLTALAAEATCQAVYETTGLRPGIKWTNDLVIGKKKLCGILTELTLEAESGWVETAIIGIGVNCGQQIQDFPPDVGAMATSLAMELGRPVDRHVLAARMIEQLERMSRECMTEKEAWLERYTRDCVTIGKDVQILRADSVLPAHADGIDENAALLVTYADGTKDRILSGEVSVRGMYGYV